MSLSGEGYNPTVRRVSWWRGAPGHGRELRAQRGHQQGHDESLLQTHRRHSPLRKVLGQEEETKVMMVLASLPMYYLKYNIAKLENYSHMHILLVNLCTLHKVHTF